ncbi:hypothetical protein A2W14_04920 [Candidatus Gottesmanbacteria bacterium RBG_16_37_8]|uniref:PIN domain-containing protein n=1 Tax=Candidatus Gottesmanbacteria bacterium RBG_16_37_8 TaxID=1798371 RepID=A0A1F5YUQ9_9BACT|nr:MAG: hypothetical protein A2W14_04920 [Candidatus Gottesmanbacteria bacterium RBG_16_37_8]
MRKLLLDTSIIIDFLRHKDKEETHLYKLSEEDLYMSIITHTELYAGKSVWEKKTARKELEELFSGIDILPLNQEISILAGQIKAFHQNLTLLDCLIAATAVYFKLDLVTFNTKDFGVLKEVRLFKENLVS